MEVLTCWGSSASPENKLSLVCEVKLKRLQGDMMVNTDLSLRFSNLQNVGKGGGLHVLGTPHVKKEKRKEQKNEAYNCEVPFKRVVL